MEATGAVAAMQEIFNNKETPAYIKTIVMDDDSSTKAKLIHPYANAIRLGHLLEWPTYINKKGVRVRKKCTGVLEDSHPVIQFLADKNHRV